MTTAIILAGGMGTRLRSVVPDLPKPMASVRERPFLEHLMDYWIKQGVTRFILSVGYKKEVIMEYFGASYQSVPLKYVTEDEPLGTGGGLLLAAQGLSEPFLVLNGDTLFKVNLKLLINFHLEHSSDWTFSLFRTAEIDRYMGIEVKPDNEITSFRCDFVNSKLLANGGVYFINPSVLKNKKLVLGSRLSLEDDLIPELVVKGYKFFGLEFDQTFIDIGVPKDYFRAAEILLI